MTWKMITPSGSFFFKDLTEAQEQASIVRNINRLPAFVFRLAECRLCGGDRQDDHSLECDVCLMEMTIDLIKN